MNLIFSLLHHFSYLFEKYQGLIFTFIIVVLIVYVAYIKIRYPFFHRQPMFHKYDFWRYFILKPFMINKNTVISSKYFDNEKIKTFKYNSFNASQIDKFVDFLQVNYINSENVLFVANQKTLTSYFSGQNNPSFISFYQEPDSKDVKACITSRSLTIYVARTHIPAYFFDYICINKNIDKTIIYKLIQTHEYNQRFLNMDVKISLFKKEINLCDGVVPLVKYDTYLFRLSNNNNRIKLPPNVTCVRITKHNIDIIFDFLEKIRTGSLKFIAFPDINNILSLLNEDEYYIYCLCHGKDVLGYYFFKNSRTIYDDINGCSGSTLQVTGSYNNIKSNDLFFIGYQYAIHSIRKIYVFNMLLFENISHNYLLIGMQNMNLLITKYECAYYLYNYIVPKMPLISNSCFILL